MAEPTRSGDRPRRGEDWPDRLHVFLRGEARRPFEWGAHDCALFACAAVEAMTGIDPAGDLRGGYTDEASAKAAITSRLGRAGTLEDLAEVIAEELGLDEVPPAFAQRGDVVLIDSPLGPALAICVGVSCVAATINGTALVPMAQARRAWRIES